jgi:hypothetical protein
MSKPHNQWEGQPGRSTVASLPPEVQAELGHNERRFIQTEPGSTNTERLDER